MTYVNNMEESKCQIMTEPDPRRAAANRNVNKAAAAAPTKRVISRTALVAAGAESSTEITENTRDTSTAVKSKGINKGIN